jgi:REP element-mobilizing transposase RayT
MPFNPIINQRRSIRLPYFDYSQNGLYFITICAHEKKYIFGRIENNKSIVNNLGKIIEEELLKTPNIRPEIKLHEYVIMPNHLHVLFQIDKSVVGPNGRSPQGLYGEELWESRSPQCFFEDDPRASSRSPQRLFEDESRASSRSPVQMKSKSVSSFVAGFKSITAKRINILRQTSGVPVWHRNYYEHVIRDDDDYFRIVNYIKSNPKKWQFDRNFRK